MKKRFRCLALALCLVSAQAASAADMGGARASLKTMGVQPTVQRSSSTPPRVTRQWST
jgi:hypothetical protein